MRLTFLRDPFAGVRLLRMSFAIADSVSFSLLLYFFNPHKMSNLANHSPYLRCIALHDEVVWTSKAKGPDGPFCILELLDNALGLGDLDFLALCHCDSD